MERRHDEEFFARIAVVLKAMADPMRLRLLNQMQQGEQCVSMLVEAVGSSQANVSKHLSVLKRAGLVRSQREGHSIIYAIDDPSLFDICGVVGQAIERRLAADQQLMHGSRRRLAGAPATGAQ